MSEQKPIGVSRVCVDADRGPLIEDVLLSVAATLLGVARAVTARYDKYLEKSERKIRATDLPEEGGAPA